MMRSEIMAGSHSAKGAIRKAGKHCGVMATSDDDLRCRIERGFLMVGVASDMEMMFRSLRQSLRTIGRDVMPATSLDNEFLFSSIPLNLEDLDGAPIRAVAMLDG